MSAPTIVSVSPDVNATDVVLATPITITFDQVINTATLDTATFTLTYQAPLQVITPRQLLDGTASPQPTPVAGTWTFSTNSSNQTVAVFTPAQPLPANTVLTAMLLGTDAALSSDVIANPAGEQMAQSYQWIFTTGALNLTTTSLRPAGAKKPRARARPERRTSRQRLQGTRRRPPPRRHPCCVSPLRNGPAALRIGLSLS